MKLSEMDKDTLAKSISGLILRGHFSDEQVMKMARAALDYNKSSRQQRARDMFHELKIGDRVRVTDNIKPRYIAGATGLITEKRQTKVVVRFDNNIGGRFSGRTAIMPTTTLIKLEAETESHD